jgi:hypothetical protein
MGINTSMKNANSLQCYTRGVAVSRMEVHRGPGRLLSDSSGQLILGMSTRFRNPPCNLKL